MARCVGVAVAVHTALGAVELNGGFDQAGEPEDEEDEGAEDDDAGEELALGDEDEDDEEEEEGEDAGGDHVGEYPIVIVIFWLALEGSGAVVVGGRKGERTRSRKRTRARLDASLLVRA